MTDESAKSVELRDYLDVLWRRRWVLMVTVPLVVVTGVLLSVRQDKVYQSTGQILIAQEVVDPSAIETQIRILEGRAVRERVVKEFPSAASASGHQAGNSRIVSVVSQSSSRTLATRTVDAYINAYIDYRRTQRVDELLKSSESTRKRIDDLKIQIDALTVQIEDETTRIDRRAVPSAGEGAAAARAREAEVARDRRELDIGPKAQRNSLLSDQLVLESNLRELNAQSSVDTTGVELVNPADEPSKPIRPKPLSDGVAAAGLGLVLGIALAFLIDYLDDSMKNKEDVQRAIGSEIPVVAMIPVVVEWRDRTKPEVVSLSSPRSPAAEAYRSLRTSVQFASVENPVNVLAVTSPGASEGKTTALANLAVVVAGAGRRVVMLDCDLRRPRIHSFFNLTNDVGFTSWIIGDSPLSAALQDVPGIPRLSLMASGPIPPNPSELLSSRRFADLVRTLHADGALLVIDTPPLLPVTDAAVIARLVDSILVVTMAGRGTRKHLRQALDILQQIDAPVTGVVLNGIEADRGRYYQAAYYGDPTAATSAAR